MKALIALAAAWFMVLGATLPARAADEDRGSIGDRLERLERRVDELTQRQEQMMQHFGGMPERQRPGFLPGPARMRGPMPMPLPGPEPRSPAREKAARDIGGLVALALLGCAVCNVLLAIWIFTDIRKRGEGPGIFIALALVAGIPTAIIYSLVRIGDRKA
jgi:hypothetical protein